jgi:hypothetical protein
MKKILTLIAIILIGSISVFAQSRKVNVKPGDTVIINNGTPNARIVEKHFPSRPKHRRSHKVALPVQQSPTVIQESFPARAIPYEPSISRAEHDRLMNQTIFYIVMAGLLGLAIGVCSVYFGCHLGRQQSAVVDRGNQTFHMHGGTAYGGRGGEANSAASADRDSNNDSSTRRNSERYRSHTSVNVFKDIPEDIKAVSPVETKI